MGFGAVTVFGPPPPVSIDMDNLCPPPPECKDCPETKCFDGGFSLYHLVGQMQVKQLNNITFTGLPNRTLDCQLYAVGKAMYHRLTNQTFGSWLRDSAPRTDGDVDKVWTTQEGDDEAYNLYEFPNKTAYANNTGAKIIRLDHPFRGNSHVIYNGSFYYQERDRPRILRYDLTTRAYTPLDVPGLPTSGDNYLYTTQYNYADLAADDNGLWVIYGLPPSNNTVVLKLDSWAMTVQFGWNISFNHHKVGEMFIVCGVLYAVDSVTVHNTKIRFALDLYKNNLLDIVNLTFINPFKKTTTLGYNHRFKELYSWDKGNQLTYPIRYHEIGYNTNSSRGDDRDSSGESTTYGKTGMELY